jgi:hypothetical protein
MSWNAEFVLGTLLPRDGAGSPFHMLPYIVKDDLDVA